MNKIAQRLSDCLRSPMTIALIKGSAITIGLVAAAIVFGLGLDALLHTRPLMISLFLILCIPGSMAATLSTAKAAEKKIKAERDSKSKQA